MYGNQYTRVRIFNNVDFINFCKRNYRSDGKYSDETFVCEIDDKFIHFSEIDIYLRKFEQADKGDDLISKNNAHSRFLSKIVFEINVNKVSGTDFGILPIVLVFCCKNLKRCHSFVVNIQAKDNKDIQRLMSYVTSVIDKKLSVKINGNLVYKKRNNFGDLPPALFVTKDILKLLQLPLNICIWNAITEIIQDNAIINIGNASESKKMFWSCVEETVKCSGGDLKDFHILLPYLKVCKRFLFDEFSEIGSVQYTSLRVAAYTSEDFLQYVKSVPFLALLIFALYDGNYRQNLLWKAKKYYNDERPSIEDLLLQSQGRQEFEKYDEYDKNKEKDDIKNLLDFYGEESDFVIAGKVASTKLSQTVIAEIFESISIAEGLLQIIENAVYHADGGLLSLRVYSRAKGLKTGSDKKVDHVEYLDRKYDSSYFQIDKIAGTDYFLEVKISDLSNKSIPQNFKSNPLIYDERNKSKITLQYFFAPNSAHLKLKKKFFNVNENLVFHYGLEIFRTILTSRKGIFAVCGYGDEYNNLDTIYERLLNKQLMDLSNLDTVFSKEVIDGTSKRVKRSIEECIAKTSKNITENKNIGGTSYNILLPLNHVSQGENVLSNEVMVQTDFELVDKCEVRTVTYNEIKRVAEKKESKKSVRNANSINATVEKKNKRIVAIAKKLKEYAPIGEAVPEPEQLQIYLSPDNKLKLAQTQTDQTAQKVKEIKLLCVDLLNAGNYFEEIIKGVILYALNVGDMTDNVLPIAIINLTRFQLIETARILAIYYSNNAIAEKIEFNKIQFYLKSVEAKDLIFSGNTLHEVRSNLVKMAMSNGSLGDELGVIEKIMCGMEDADVNQ